MASVIRQLNNPQADFQMIPRRLVQLGLSAEAVGLMVIVACAPPSEDLSAAWIEAACGFGREKRQRVMRELVGAGLLRVRSDQASDGRWSKLYVFDWAVIMTPKAEKPASVKGDDRERVIRRRETRSSREPENPSIVITEDPEGRVAACGEATLPSGAVVNVEVVARPSVEGCFDQNAANARSLGLRWRNQDGKWMRPVTGEDLLRT